MNYKIFSLFVLALLSACSSGEAETVNYDNTCQESWCFDDGVPNYLDHQVAIKLDAAIQQNLTGAGITVAVVDSGIRADHEAFGGRVTSGVNTYVYPSTTDTADDNGHGTHVAATLAGGSVAPGYDGKVGVAPSADIIATKVLGSTGTSTTHTGGESLALGFQTLTTSSAKIVSVSIAAGISPSSRDVGYTDDDRYLKMKELTDAGKLVVVGAGNGLGEGLQDNVPATFVERPELSGRSIAVGWYDVSSGEVYGNSPGVDWMNYYLVAPGSSVTSADHTGTTGYRDDSGSSMATPQVSGAAALLMEKWPTKAAEEIATLLLCTATDLGTAGVDPIYGHGLLNIEAALASGGICP